MITIKRIKCTSDFNRKYTVRIDGKKICSIKNGKEESFEIDNGRHAIKITLDWCSSNIIEFDYKQGDDIVFMCHSSQKDSKSPFSLKKLTIDKDSYIILYQKKA